MNFSDLNPEFCEKAKNCKSPEELFELAKEEGVEIPDEDLEGVSGGEEAGQIAVTYRKPNPATAARASIPRSSMRTLRTAS